MAKPQTRTDKGGFAGDVPPEARPEVGDFGEPSGDGWEDAGEQLVGWFSAALNKPVQGVLLRSKERTSTFGGVEQRNDFWIMRLTRPAIVLVQGGDEEAASVGDLIGVGQSASLKSDFEDDTRGPALGLEVYIKPLGKKKTGRGNTVWTYHTKINRAPF